MVLLGTISMTVKTVTGKEKDGQNAVVVKAAPREVTAPFGITVILTHPAAHSTSRSSCSTTWR
jgi:hypothetical protein